MTYSPTEPQDTPPPAIAVNQLQTNFAQFGTIFANNHTALNNTNQGKHEAVIFQQQTSDPGVTDDYDCLYCKNVTTASGSFNELFLQIPQFLSAQYPNRPQQLTYNSVKTTGPQYQSFLPGGYLMYWGSVNSVPSTITLSPLCSGIASVVVSAHNFTSVGTPIPFDAYAFVTGNNTFNIESSLATGAFTITYVAIGIQ